MVGEFVVVAGGGVVGVVPVQPPRSRHNDGVDAGFHPAPGYAVCATSAA
ncbi:hypothetical protein L083_4802 [Actinoplanes sp. N902-109]|nr:hypothetical protein L083_4802 [Actinoplanes sp. N902-109]